MDELLLSDMFKPVWERRHRKNINILTLTFWPKSNIHYKHVYFYILKCHNIVDIEKADIKNNVIMFT